jgi:hypothetical protein
VAPRRFRVHPESVTDDDPLRPTVERSWRLHLAVAGKLAADPDGVLAHGRARLECLRNSDSPRDARWLERWQALLDAGPQAVLEVLTAHTDEEIDFCRSSPFVGVLTQEERLAVLNAFRVSRGMAALEVTVADVAAAARAGQRTGAVDPLA